MFVCFSKKSVLGTYSSCNWRLILWKEGNKNLWFLYNSFKNKIIRKKLFLRVLLRSVALKENQITRKSYKFPRSSLTENNLEVCCRWAVGDAVCLQVQCQPERSLSEAWCARHGIPNIETHCLVW